MKKIGLILIVMIFVLSFMSCAIINTAGYLEDWDYDFDDGLSFSSVDEAFDFVYSIPYKYDSVMLTNDYWQTPEETLIRWSGDCEDHAILFMYLIHKYCGIEKPCLIALENNKTGIGHAVVRLKNTGQYYDPTTGLLDADVMENMTVIYTYNYGETMYSAENKHNVIWFLR